MLWNKDRAVVGRFLGHYDTARGQVRTELVRRHIQHHLPAGAAVVDLGAGDGQLALRLAEAGHRVTLVEPSPLMIAAAEDRLRKSAPGGGVTLVRATAQHAARVLPRASFDAVLCHGVLMYVDDPADIIQAIAALARPGGLISVLTKNAAALAVRPALQGDFATALSSFDSHTTIGWLGVPTRGDTVESLYARLAEHGISPVDWYGVGVFTDHLTDIAPVSVQQWDTLLETEWQASRRDPYRAIARLIHVIGHTD